MVEHVEQERRELRAHGRLARSRIGAAHRSAATTAITERLLGLPELVAADHVLLTAAVGVELDLAELRTALRTRGVVVCLPVVDGDDLLAVDLVAGAELRPGWQGVIEPVGPPTDEVIDVVVLPALSLDRRGGRLGYGGGHFDRFLAGRAAGAATIGAVFDTQLVDVVPTLPHDVVLDVIVTERGVWRGGAEVAHSD
jgi:5-formyltetrahydrofolate cyclo-ligase